ncbi:ABC transporter ATP-binding protein [Blautia pseudococcoides]|uniref:ABC transporter ATP-binding protein n=2 Tax=Blautia pseudococcoides TaxID=1796616 RepID=UPI00148B1866|nr:ABC transporter ATP-binding protein [Blautia pseudococcoides]QJU13657.1 ABC transporter ATP-binding protein [Blautia pseudococcoides]
MKIVELKNVSRYYKAGQQKNYALKKVSFGIEEGEFVVILGASGAGKSTMLNLLGGIDRADEGEILVAGEDIAKLSEKALSKYRAKRVGFVFQFYNLIPTLTVKENVELMRELKKDALGASEALQKVGLSVHERKFPEQLSGGEQQRVSIARAIAKNPDILLCDEPTGALDAETGCMVLLELQKLSRDEGKTVLLVTHNANIARAADRVIHVRSGEIKEIECNADPCSMKEVEW